MKQNSLVKWLGRDLITGPYLVLCTNEKQFRKALKHLNFSEWATFPALGSSNADATTHHLTNAEGDTVSIVYFPPPPEKRGIDNAQIAAMLVHEAVHVWQEFVESIGENKPSREFEAYAIQAITQRLLYDYARQVWGTSETKPTKTNK